MRTSNVESPEFFRAWYYWSWHDVSVEDAHIFIPVDMSVDRITEGSESMPVWTNQ